MTQLPEYYDIPKEKKKRNKYPKDLPPKYKQYLVSTTNKGIRMDITIPEFEELIRQDCNYCGEPNAQGLDKIDPKGHYILDNAVSCCSKCNTMKFIYSVPDFLSHVEKIYKFNNP